MHKQSILVKKLIEFNMCYIVQYQENGTGWNSTLSDFDSILVMLIDTVEDESIMREDDN